MRRYCFIVLLTRKPLHTFPDALNLPDDFIKAEVKGDLAFG